jgi:hypothetical protein
MSVTITITVSPTGAAEVRTGADVAAEAPPPSPADALGGAAIGETGEEAAGPPPAELEQLGLGGAEIGEGAGGPPPQDVEAASEEPEVTAEAPEPRPIEELE